MAAKAFDGNGPGRDSFYRLERFAEGAAAILAATLVVVAFQSPSGPGGLLAAGEPHTTTRSRPSTVTVFPHLAPEQLSSVATAQVLGVTLERTTGTEGNEPVVEVPDVTGLTLGPAAATLFGEGLVDVAYVTGCYRSQLIGTVISQSPVAGQLAHPGDPVLIRLQDRNC